MKRLLARLLLLTVVLPLLTPADARADFYSNWSYFWTVDSTDIRPPDGAGAVNIAVKPGGDAMDTIQTAILSTNPAATDTTYTADPNNPAYTLSLNITDNATKGSITLNFAATLSGILNLNSSVSNTFLNPTQTSDPLNGQVYTVTIGPAGPTALLLPSQLNPSTDPDGNGGNLVFATISTAPVPTGGGSDGGGNNGGGTPPPTQTTPEPASLVLAGLASSLVGLASWRQRRRARQVPALV